jgi:beta-galactosidase GanA
LRDEELLTQLGARAATNVARLAGDGLRFVALADEASSTRHNNPLDVCRCGRCLDAFRAFAKARYATIEAINEAWGTQFASFDAVEPLARLHGLGLAIGHAHHRARPRRLDSRAKHASAAAHIEQ